MRITTSGSGRHSTVATGDRDSVGVTVEPEQPPRREARAVALWSGWAAVSTWSYAVVILVLLALIRWVGEGWWGVTVILFVPRWLFLVPIAILALASGLARRPSLWALQAAIGVLVAGPLMGLSLPVAQLWNPRPQGTTFRILSYNVGPGQVNGKRLIELIERERIDFISFQERPEAVPELEAYFSRGWYRDSSKFLASRYPIVGELPRLLERNADGDRFSARLNRVRVRVPNAGELILASVHIPTIRPGLNRFLEGDVAGLKLHIEWWASELGRVVGLLAETGPTPLLLAGDFNMPSDDSSMASLRSFLRFGFDEAGFGYGFTRPTAAPWFRIDHILASPHWSFTRCWIGPDFGSDHLPILAEVVLPLSDRAAARTRP